MRIHRFYMENIDISNLVTHETDLIHQLKNVFRYKPGQIIHVFNDRVGEIEVEIIDLNKKDMSFKFIRQIRDIDDLKQNKRNITLYMSIIKNSNFDLIVEKITEIGVSKIIPVVMERTIKNNLNTERLNKIAKEATEQSGRLDLLDIKDPILFSDLLKLMNESSDYKVFGSVSNKNNFGVSCDKNIGNVSIIIGPEGGFTEREEKELLINKIIPVCINKNVLRAETAAILLCGFYSL